MENKNNQMQFVAAISQCDKSDFHRFWSKMHFMEFRSKKNIERKGNAANEDEKCVQITNEMQLFLFILFIQYGVVFFSIKINCKIYLL